MTSPLAGLTRRSRQVRRLILDSEYRKHRREFARLSTLPRYQATTTKFLGKRIAVPDAFSFLKMYHEIFSDQVYKFASNNDAPSIIDAGANIGLSVIYFKSLFPKAKIVAFEPDPQLFSVLQSNMAMFGYDVMLHQKAVWSAASTVPFCAEGSWAGRVVAQSPGLATICVPAVRLRDYLSERVDMLKIDIEGAETEVLVDCSDLLKNVANLFVEYHSFSGRPQQLHVLLKMLSEAGFRYNVQGTSTQQPLMTRDQPLDNLASIWAYRS